MTLGRGGSMRPLIPDRTPLEIIPADPASIRAGDCIAYRLGGALLVHRVWRRTRAGFWVKDDAGTVPLHFVPAADAAGRARAGRASFGGLPGLAWGLLANLVFACGRRLAGAIRRGCRIERNTLFSSA